MRKKITTAIFTAVVLFCANFLFERYFLNETSAVKNFGFVFSLPLSDIWIYMITLSVLIAVSWIYWNFESSERAFGAVAYGLILGGAVFNLYSRLSQGFVWDYLHLRVWSLMGAWNLADLGVLSGILIWFIIETKKEG